MRIALAVAALLAVTTPAFADTAADLPSVTVNRTHKADRAPQMLCITLAPSPTSIPACIDLTQLPGFRR